MIAHDHADPDALPAAMANLAPGSEKAMLSQRHFVDRRIVVLYRRGGRAHAGERACAFT